MRKVRDSAFLENPHKFNHRISEKKYGLKRVFSFSGKLTRRPAGTSSILMGVQDRYKDFPPGDLLVDPGGYFSGDERNLRFA